MSTATLEVPIDDEVAGVAYNFDPDYEAEPKVSAFARYERLAWPHVFDLTLDLVTIAGGIPSNPNVAEAWIRSKLGVPNDEMIAAQVAETMKERGIDAEAGASEVAKIKTLNGFKRHADKGLYIEGRQLKACIKEATSIAVGSGQLAKRGWGTTNKGIWSFVAEHVCVVEDRLYLGRTDPDEIVQRFVSTYNGSGIRYEEVCHEVQVKATIKSNYDFDEKTWALIFLTAQEQGLGAARSQGFGRFVATEWKKRAK